MDDDAALKVPKATITRKYNTGNMTYTESNYKIINWPRKKPGRNEKIPRKALLLHKGKLGNVESERKESKERTITSF